MGRSVREKLGQSVKKGGLSNDELHHPSRAYERHFEGYVETFEPVPGKKRSRSVRTYVDAYWRQELSARRRLWLRILFVVLYLMALPPFLYSATRNIAANTVWFVTLPQAASVFTLSWTALNLYRYCVAPQVMTVRQHRLGVVWFRRTSCAAWIALAVTASGYLIQALTAPGEKMAVLLCALLCLISCGCILSLFLVERTVSYMECENPLSRDH